MAEVRLSKDSQYCIGIGKENYKSIGIHCLYIAIVEEEVWLRPK